MLHPIRGPPAQRYGCPVNNFTHNSPSTCLRTLSTRGLLVGAAPTIMSKTKTKYLCDVCKSPATHLVRDLYDVTESTAVLVRFEFQKGFRSRCDKHKTESNIIDRRPKLL